MAIKYISFIHYLLFSSETTALEIFERTNFRHIQKNKSMSIPLRMDKIKKKKYQELNKACKFRLIDNKKVFRKDDKESFVCSWCDLSEDLNIRGMF